MAHMMFSAIHTMVLDNVPGMLGDSLRSGFRYLFSSNQITIKVDEHEHCVSSVSGAMSQNKMTRNQIFDAAMVYLPTKMSHDTRSFKVSKTPTQRSLKIGVEPGVQVVDRFDNNNVVLKWKFTQHDGYDYEPRKRFFELSFNKKYKDRVLDGEDGYLEFVMKKSMEIVNNIEKVVKIHGDSSGCDMYGRRGNVGDPIILNHPITFDKLAMDPELKKAIIDDLDRFLRGQEFYKKVGKAWKRGYLLYGPPGTGKSSLIAAMANHLKFDVYDLDLTSVGSNAQLKSILVSTTNRSIIVIEDIDCNVEMQVRRTGIEESDRRLTLSGLLNFMDGLWSSCGDERIIIFTTNYKDRLDPALLRPGRMDMEIHMSYCTGKGFRFLASNYLNIHDDHRLFGEIEDLIANVEVTPAEVAEHLRRNEDADIALTGVVNFLKRKTEANGIEEDKANVLEVPEPKRLKIGNNCRKGCLRKKK